MTSMQSDTDTDTDRGAHSASSAAEDSAAGTDEIVKTPRFAWSRPAVFLILPLLTMLLALDTVSSSTSSTPR